MIEFLQGKKTYILGGLGIATIVAYYFNVIPQEMAQQLLVLFGFGGLITLGAKINRG